MDFGAVAHDLRTPLNVMLGQVQLLAVECLSDTGRHRLGILERQVHRMMRLLDACREHEVGTTSRGPVDLHTLIHNVVSELEAVLERQGIEMTSNIDGVIPFVFGDGDLLHRVPVNVLINAAESIPGSGRIKIGARAEQTSNALGGTIHIDITDTGVGIPADLISRVFELGFTTKPSGEPRGLGLNICREIIQMHDGRLELSSEPGVGTTVRLSLPAKV